MINHKCFLGYNKQYPKSNTTMTAIKFPLFEWIAPEIMIYLGPLNFYEGTFRMNRAVLVIFLFILKKVPMTRLKLSRFFFKGVVRGDGEFIYKLARQEVLYG